jgi:chemotaxis protein CheD
LKRQSFDYSLINDFIKNAIKGDKAKIVRIGEYKVSDNREDTLRTLALGSCVSVVCYDHKKKIGGMIHVVQAKEGSVSTANHPAPGYFADTGIPAMLDRMIKKGALLENIWAKIIGGAKVINIDHDVGKENITAVRHALKKCGLKLKGEDVGGVNPRTVAFKIGTGEVVVSTAKVKWNI